jgi:DNA-binding NarL/FixJ family response regulator
MIKVMIVDDQALVRAGFRALIDNREDLHVVAEAANGREALDLARASRPDIFLMDLQMPVMGGLETISAIRADPLLGKVPVLVLTTFDDDEDVINAIQAGASGYLLKDIAPDLLRDAIRTAIGGGSPVAPSIASQLLHHVARTPSRAARTQLLATLTSREIEILTHVGMGLSNEEIGRALYLSPETSRTYVSRLITKLGVRDRVQLVVLAHRTGLVG